MNKRITSIVLSLAMLFTMLATAVPVLAATPVELKVTADTTSANPGDTINYKVSVGAVTDMGGLEFKLDIPSGLTVVDGSISIPDGLETIIDSDGPIIVPTSSNRYYWLYSAQLTGYTGTSDLVILTFSCKVDDGTTGTKTVSIKEVVLIDQSVKDMPFNVTGADVNVTAAPVSVTGVTIDETLSVNIGQTKTPSFTVAPAEATNKTVSFTSDNPAVATVNATTGAVTGVSKGTATITVKTADGNFTDTCKVTVSCAHTNKSTVTAKDSTCTVKGWDEYKKCDDCGQLFDKNGNEISAIPYLPLADHTPAQTATDDYLQSAATCTSAAVYFKHCSVCDVKLNTTFTSGSTVPHTESGWKRDKDGHWKECTVCGTITTAKVAHTPDHEGHATEEYAIKCSVCDYIITPALGMQDYIVEMPVSIAVKLTGDKKPAKETFKFEIYDLGVEDAEFEIVKDGITVENLEFDENGVAFAGGIIKIKVTGEDQLSNLTEGFSVRMVKGSTKGWTYASEQWRIEPSFENDALDLVITVKEIVDGEISEEYANGMSFAVSYEAVSEPDPTEPDPIKIDPIKIDPTEPTESNPNTGALDDVPQTGDNSNMSLWIVLLLASGLGVTGTAVYNKRKKCVK